ncbi:3',5'-cyclic-nucleotide phosphodiesterase [Methylobacterium tarhaniae]|uniref:3',5'-cyclic-nucleotide phosphodiesterase n=1 Tax=Methylobacterium tarhaniae TaxID=1187852 RepID=A0A0J6TD14_9HYPH|nr:3',5'-cyclic-nucleotide phosphodiesterase [Methylobacterium tarhaniae]
MTLRPMSLALLTAGSLMLLAGPALAQRDDPNLKKYCTGDYMTYCGNLPPESPEVDRCFEKNMKKISVNCKRAIDYYEQTHKK